jgi:hypothetical protein
MKNTDLAGRNYADLISTNCFCSIITYLNSHLAKEGVMTKDQRNYLKRAGRRTKHHILARSKKGKYTPQNLILLDERRHSAFHLLFGLKTFREAASILIRAAEMKERQIA